MCCTRWAWSATSANYPAETYSRCPGSEPPGWPRASPGHDLALEFPGACVAGPFRESLRLVEALRQGGRVGDVTLLEPDTCAALLRDHRPADMVDESAGRPRRWGWGVALEQVDWGPASAASFGALGGTACSVVADPPAGVSVALYFLGNVMPDERLRRDRLVHDAVWRDLRIG